MKIYYSRPSKKKKWDSIESPTPITQSRQREPPAEETPMLPLTQNGVNELEIW